jgi:hypothetical protein
MTTPFKRYAAGALLCALLLTALGGRVLRGMDVMPGESPVAGAEARIDDLLAGGGWRPGEKLPITGDFTYAARVYRKEGCPPLLVSVVGGGGDADGLFRRPGAPPWRFMHGGRAYERPPSVRFLVDSIIAAIMPGVDAPPPIIAVARIAEAPACEGPTPAEWRQLARAPAAGQDGMRTAAE